MTVDVQYVDSDTYLGVYKYTLSTDNIQLIREVEAGFTGTIKTTVDIRTEIYVQMHPNGTSGSAIFDVSSSISNASADDGISGGTIASVILVMIILSVVIGLCIYYRRALKKCFLKIRNSMEQCCKRRMMPVNNIPYPTSEANQPQMPMDNVNVIYIDTEPGLFTQSAGSTQTSSGSGGTTESTERNSKGISGGILALIIIFSLLGGGALFFGSVFLIAYCEQRTKRRRNTPVRRITPTVEVASGTPDVVSGAPVTNNETNKKFYQIGSNTSDLNAFNNSHTNFSTSTPVSDNNVDEEERNEDLVLEEIPVGENST